MKKTYMTSIVVIVIIVVFAIYSFSSKNTSINSQKAVVLEAVSAAQNFGHLSPKAFLDKSNQSGVIIIDVRTKAEYDAGHIDNSINIDFYSPDFKTQMNALNKNVTYLIYCRSGHRSGLALDLMKGMGFVDASDLSGGYLALN